MSDYPPPEHHEPHPTQSGWLVIWMEAAMRQHGRIRATREFFELQSDLMLFAVAVGAVVLICEGMLGKDHREVSRFREACHQAKHVRDIASHLDEYAVGTGRLQRAGHANGGTYLSRDRETGTVAHHHVMRSPPANTLPVGRLPRATIPPIDGRLPVQARIVDGRAEPWVNGMAHAWTRDAVCVWWTDTDSLRRIDWLRASDVRRALAVDPW
jgi:hypothetical protein